MILTTVRNIFTTKSTGGVTLINGERFCCSQEDPVRAYGVKIYGETAIAPGSYKVGVRRSASFERQVLCLYTEKEGWWLHGGGISFQHCYFHGGNHAGNTKGCILVAFDRGDDDTIYNTAESALFNKVNAAIDSGESVIAQVINDFDNVYGLR